ncbi:hypothetical protein [Parvularcula sp. LCG005]|uniref:hypothetical protein n=1 Tax=Parvularcula sp. LCG005 TaxID=3078805 RepID=UPI002943498C|nr:hypothetical protein [Parvularcula sp. LCG005]WOI53433.1 hypothetical protein RUI03_00215 [Parvularcula sp. LCG005]
MGVLGRVISKFFSFLFLPLRLLGRLFFRSARPHALNTVRKAVGNAVAADAPTVEEVAEMPEPTAGSFLFKAIDRPKLSEGSAAELSLPVAREFVANANRFYTSQFGLFPEGHFFYEEIELAELSQALSADDPRSADSRFVVWMDLFRQTINDNARRLLLIVAPVLFGLMMAGAVGLSTLVPQLNGLGSWAAGLPSSLVFLPLATLIGLTALLLIYQWPFKVIIQRNLLGMDNYITSRFSRINQNFQVAKRHALNVERNKRMTQTEELKDEAGIWTVAYNWFAIRLFLCERVVRNQMYQVNRNATLYAMAGISLCIILALAVGGVWWSLGTGATPTTLGMLAACSAVFIITNYAAIMGGAASEARRVLQDNEWFRFGAAELNRTIADHVGEDKLQIVTFRDRNRME